MPSTADIVAATLAPDFDDLEPRLTRQGYSVKVLAEQFHARPTEIRRFLNGQLDPGRTRELPEGTCPWLSSTSFVQGSTR